MAGMLGDLIPVAIIVAILDSAVVLGWMARGIDSAMLGAERPWRFGLAALLGFTALIALNVGIFAAVVLHPRF
jgi:hypothetical protein